MDFGFSMMHSTLIGIPEINLKFENKFRWACCSDATKEPRHALEPHVYPPSHERRIKLKIRILRPLDYPGYT